MADLVIFGVHKDHMGPHFEHPSRAFHHQEETTQEVAKDVEQRRKRRSEEGEDSIATNNAWPYFIAKRRIFGSSTKSKGGRSWIPSPLVYAAEELHRWFALKRDHAAVVAFDTDVFPLFQQHCKRRPLPEFWRQQSMYGDPSKQHNCIPDEHYVQTLLAIRGYEDEIERRTLTFTQWDQSGKNRERKGWHPVTFALSDASSELINSIKNITSVYYETEYRREWCSSNGTARPCFLFARKFTRGATLKLLNETLKS
ncbi:hypothetical protein L7F22_030844 [Adiantum nelumboides]|nr:hypothetical protein [Adiantum nelumboides]